MIPFRKNKYILFKLERNKIKKSFSKHFSNSFLLSENEMNHILKNEKHCKLLLIRL
jgi:hypothetical protein